MIDRLDRSKVTERLGSEDPRIRRAPKRVADLVDQVVDMTTVRAPQRGAGVEGRLVIGRTLGQAGPDKIGPSRLKEDDGDELCDSRGVDAHDGGDADGGDAGGRTGTAGDGGPGGSRGKYLVTVLGCNDCHSPKKMTPQGPEPDMTRMLSGHPMGEPLPPPPKPVGPWIVSATGDLTAWAGPWGISYATNLTPDENTGLGIWTEDCS